MANKLKKAAGAAKPAKAKTDKPTKAAKVAKVAKPAGERKERKPGVGALVKDLILKGKSNPDILATVNEKFPESKTTNGSVNWYRSDLRKAGHDVPSSRTPKAKPVKAAKEKVTSSKGGKKVEGKGGF